MHGNNVPLFEIWKTFARALCKTIVTTLCILFDITSNNSFALNPRLRVSFCGAAFLWNVVLAIFMIWLIFHAESTCLFVPKSCDLFLLRRSQQYSFEKCHCASFYGTLMWSVVLEQTDVQTTIGKPNLGKFDALSKMLKKLRMTHFIYYCRL